MVLEKKVGRGPCAEEKGCRICSMTQEEIIGVKYVKCMLQKVAYANSPRVY